MNLEYVPCNLCGEENTKLLFKTQDLRFSDTPRFTFQVVRCLSCGLIYVNPRPSRKDISLYYPSKYYQKPMEGKKQNPSGKVNTIARLLKVLYTNRIYQRKKKALFEKYKRIKKVMKKPAMLLDIGSGNGEFLSFMKDHSWKVEGVEISKEMANFCREQQLFIHNKDFLECELPQNYFDLITLWETLEHLHDPLGALLKVNKLLKPGGIIAISVPNACSLEFKILFLSNIDKRPFDVPRHLYHFSPQTIEKMFKKANLKIIKIYHTNKSTTPRIESVLLETLGLTKTQKNVSLIRKIFNVTLSELAYSISRFISVCFGLIKQGHTMTIIGVKPK